MRYEQATIIANGLRKVEGCCVIQRRKIGNMKKKKHRVSIIFKFRHIFCRFQNMLALYERRLNILNTLQYIAGKDFSIHQVP